MSNSQSPMSNISFKLVQGIEDNKSFILRVSGQRSCLNLHEKFFVVNSLQCVQFSLQYIFGTWLDSEEYLHTQTIV